MAKNEYLSDCIRKSDLPIIVRAVPILQEYSRSGYRVTLRQLHYQFVARGYMPNTRTTYTKICEAMLRGRMGGMIDWNWIEDRTRVLRSLPRWENPADILDTCVNQFHVDYWKNQECRVEVWIEKDALLGVIEGTCRKWDCPYFSCRGYPSTSELHEASLRIKRFNMIGQDFKILYCGDHDPSGLDMGDSIMRTLEDFGTEIEFQRIALTMEQIEMLNPPPNQIKESDSRAKEYCNLYGNECWELDALPPHELNRIVETAIIDSIDDMDDFDSRREEDTEGRERLRVIGKHFDEAHEWAETFERDDEDETYADDDDDEEEEEEENCDEDDDYEEDE